MIYFAGTARKCGDRRRSVEHGRTRHPRATPRGRLQTRAFSGQGAFFSNPLLNGRAFPLRPRIANQAGRNFVAIQQPIEHEREIDIGDRPAVEKVFAAMPEQFAGGSTELSGCYLCCRRKRRGDRLPVEDGQRWTFLADRMKSLRSQA